MVALTAEAELGVEFRRVARHSVRSMTHNKFIGRKNSTLLPTTPLVVGTVHSRGSLAAALRATPAALDVLEFRVDGFAPDPGPLLAAAPRVKLPTIVTVRHPAEGGAHGLSVERRRELYRVFLPWAHYLDVELRSVAALSELLVEARERGVRIIVSSHDFRRTPTTAEMRRRAVRAMRAGADIFKMAAFTRKASELTSLLALFATPPPLPLSVMGMGPLGKISRLLFGRLGSLLNYGYLHRPNADGQWEARELKRRLGEV